MARHQVHAGDTWYFDTTLYDRQGEEIVSLSNAWFAFYSDPDLAPEITKTLTDSEMTMGVLEDNVLTTKLEPATTEPIVPGEYYVDIKIEAVGGDEATITYRDIAEVLADSPLTDDH